MTARDEAPGAVRIKAVLCLHCGTTVLSDPKQTTVDDMDKLRQAFIDHDARCESNPTVAALAAERQLSDRLGEALEECGEHQRECPLAHFDAGRPTGSGGYEMCYKGRWYEVKPNDCRPKCSCGLDAALSAWRAARGKALGR